MTFNKNQIIPALENAVRNSFENALFVDFDKAQEIKTPAFNSTDQVTVIEMRQPFDGSLYLVISYELASEILKSMQGTGSIPLELLVDETMAEICNTVAGRFMAEIVPSDQEFNFSLPICTKVAIEKSIHNKKKNSFTLEFTHKDKPFYCMFKN